MLELVNEWAGRCGRHAPSISPPSDSLALTSTSVRCHTLILFETYILSVHFSVVKGLACLIAGPEILDLIPEAKYYKLFLGL